MGFNALILWVTVCTKARVIRLQKKHAAQRPGVSKPDTDGGE
jgi:hypothetical protein